MRILITESIDFSSSAVALLRSHGNTVALKQYNYDSLKDVISRYDCLIVRLGIRLDEKLLKEGSALKYIVTSTTGLNHIDMKFCRSRGIQVISLKGDTALLKTITSTAELTWALILNVIRSIVPATIAVSNCEWNRNAYIGREVQAKTLGIIGLGRLGTLVAGYGQAFGAEVIYFDPHVIAKQYKRCKTISQLANQSDIVTVHIPLNENTENSIDRSFFKHCKKGAVFVNTSRGEIVNEADLLRALRSNYIAGAGLDVLRGEVGQTHMTGPLVKYAKKGRNLIITPHIGGATTDAMRKTEKHIVRKFIDIAKS